MTSAVYILGGYQTDFAKVWSREGQDISDIVRESVLGALDNCRLDVDSVESIHVGNAFGELQRQQAHLGAMVSTVVPGLWGKPAGRHEGACASASLAVLAAMAEIEAGRYDCVLVVGAEEFKNLPGDVASRNQNAAGWMGREKIDCQFLWPAVFGRLAGEYERRYGLDRRYLNSISENNYGNARRNPLAQTRKWRFTAQSFTDDNEANPVIEPGTRRQDCGQITDGGCAVVLASAKFARSYAEKRGSSLDQLPRILGWGHSTAGLPYLEKIERSASDPYVMPHVRSTIASTFARAGIKDVSELDGIETHDCFSMTEYMAIDHFGLTPAGQSWRAVEAGDIRMGGKLPINPSGGLIGCGHPVGATGARMLFDAAKQVSNTAGPCQVEGAKRFATLNIGGSAATVVSFVVGL